MNQRQLELLTSDTPVTQARYFESLPSSNDHCLEWIEGGAPDFSLVVANRQTAGRGRLQRRWVTQSDDSLAFSVIWSLTPDEEANSSLLSLLAGAALNRALETHLALHPLIKWPNDILLNGSKVAGILVENVWQGTNAHAVIGIGVNVGVEAVPGEIETGLPAASIEQAAGVPVDRWNLLRSILNELGNWRVSGDWPGLVAYVQSRLSYLGQAVEVSDRQAVTVQGLLSGIDSSGALLLQSSQGVVTVRTGDMHLRLQGNGSMV